MLYSSEYFSIDSDNGGSSYIISQDEVLVIPYTNKEEIIFAIEPSAAFGDDMLLLPGGIPEAGETNLFAANRELQEELGFKAGRLDFLGEILPWSKYLQVRSFVFLGRDLSRSKLVGDESHKIGRKRVPLARFETLITANKLRDARVIASLFMAKQFLAQES